MPQLTSLLLTIAFSRNFVYHLNINELFLYQYSKHCFCQRFWTLWRGNCDWSRKSRLINVERENEGRNTTRTRLSILRSTEKWRARQSSAAVASFLAMMATFTIVRHRITWFWDSAIGLKIKWGFGAILSRCNHHKVIYGEVWFDFGLFLVQMSFGIHAWSYCPNKFWRYFWQLEFWNFLVRKIRQIEVRSALLS